MSKYLHRDEAPFGATVWNHIDEVVIGTARGQLSARRLLDIEGPYGFGVKALMETDTPAGDTAQYGGAEATLSAAASLPLATVRATFTLGARDIAAYEDHAQPLGAGPAAMAAIACAQQEDNIVFNGSKDLGIAGLVTAKETLSHKLKSWNQVGAAVDNLIDAVTKLDDAGFHGPYTLALAPKLFNMLFRRYPQGNATEIEHVRQLLGGSVVKAPAIEKGGVLLVSQKYFASIAIGLDMTVGFIGPGDEGYDFFVIETLVPRIRQPKAVCVLNE